MSSDSSCHVTGLLYNYINDHLNRCKWWGISEVYVSENKEK